MKLYPTIGLETHAEAKQEQRAAASPAAGCLTMRGEVR